MPPATRTSRSAAEQKGKSNKMETVISGTIAKKQNGKKAAKAPSKPRPKGKSPVEVSFAAVEEVHSAPQAEGTGNSPTFAGGPDNAFNPGFRPTIDSHYLPSLAELQFRPTRERRATIFPTSPVKVSPATASFSNYSRRKSGLEGSMPYDFNLSSSMASSAAGGPASASPRQSLFGRMDSVSVGSPFKEALAGGGSPSKSSIAGNVASASRSSRGPKTPDTPFTPQSPYGSGIRRPAKITVVAATKPEAEGVLARQQLVRESLFELREILTNLNWKVQQFEALVDKAENDVIWDTAAAEGVFEQEQTPNSAKKLRFSLDQNL